MSIVNIIVNNKIKLNDLFDRVLQVAARVTYILGRWFKSASGRWIQSPECKTTTPQNPSTIITTVFYHAVAFSFSLDQPVSNLITHKAHPTMKNFIHFF